MNAKGLTLLEVVAALVVFGLIGVAYLEVFGGTSRLAENARTWSRAVAYAEDGVEMLKLEPSRVRTTASERSEGGFERRVEVHPWSDGLLRVTVVVLLPGGGRYELERLFPVP